MGKRLKYLVMSGLISLGTTLTAQTLAGYEYWIDNDNANRVSGALSGEQSTFGLNVSLDGLTEDMHLLHLRLINSEGQSSEPRHYVFYNLTGQSPAEPKKTSAFEYWFDNDYSERVSKRFSANMLGFEVDLSHLSYGLHFMHLRILNDINQWSEPKSYLVYTIEPTVDESDLSIVGYQYSFNRQTTFVPFKGSKDQKIIAEFETPDVVEVCPIDDASSFTVSTAEAKLQRTAHVDFQVRFLNSANQWSMPVSQDYTEDYELAHSYQSMQVDEVLVCDKALPGDFLATSITLSAGPNYSLSADQPCTIALYNRRGVLQGQYMLEPGKNVNLAIGTTLYCVVHSTLKDNEDCDQSHIRLLFSTDEEEALEPLIYDINDDGYIDHDDVVCMRDILLGRDTQGLRLKAADVNEDGTVSVGDIMALLKYIEAHQKK